MSLSDAFLNWCPVLGTPQYAMCLVNFLFFGFCWICISVTIDQRTISSAHRHDDRCVWYAFGWYSRNELYFFFVRSKYSDWCECCAFGHNQATPWRSHIHILIENANSRDLTKTEYAISKSIIPFQKKFWFYTWHRPTLSDLSIDMLPKLSEHGTNFKQSNWFISFFDCAFQLYSTHPGDA